MTTSQPNIIETFELIFKHTKKSILESHMENSMARAHNWTNKVKRLSRLNNTNLFIVVCIFH